MSANAFNLDQSKNFSFGRVKVCLLNDRILHWSKSKAWQNTKNVAIEWEFVLKKKKVENIVEREENTGYRHIPFFSQCF